MERAESSSTGLAPWRHWGLSEGAVELLRPEIQSPCTFSSFFKKKLFCISSLPFVLLIPFSISMHLFSPWTFSYRDVLLVKTLWSPFQTSVHFLKLFMLFSCSFVGAFSFQRGEVCQNREKDEKIGFFSPEMDYDGHISVGNWEKCVKECVREKVGRICLLNKRSQSGIKGFRKTSYTFDLSIWNWGFFFLSCSTSYCLHFNISR